MRDRERQSDMDGGMKRKRERRGERERERGMDGGMERKIDGWMELPGLLVKRNSLRNKCRTRRNMTNRFTNKV